MVRWLKFMAIAAAVLVAAASLGVSIGLRRDRTIGLDLESAVVAQARAGSPHASSSQDFEPLPAPVTRYLRFAMRENQPAVRMTRFDQRGEMRADLSSSSWLPFRASQLVAVTEPAFVWDAKIQLAPFVHVRVRDAFVNNQGLASVRLESAFTVLESSGGSLNEGELYRFLGEAPLYPTVLLPGDRLRWAPLDDHRAIATLTHSGVAVSVEFRFGSAGEVAAIYAANRARKSGTEFIPTPWEGHWKRYEERGGMRVPTDGEVGWWIDGALQLVWRGTILSQSFGS